MFDDHEAAANAAHAQLIDDDRVRNCVLIPHAECDVVHLVAQMPNAAVVFEMHLS